MLLKRMANNGWDPPNAKLAINPNIINTSSGLFIANTLDKGTALRK